MLYAVFALILLCNVSLLFPLFVLLVIIKVTFKLKYYFHFSGFDNICSLPSEYTAAAAAAAATAGVRKKYSLLTQFLKTSGILPTIARRISVAAISRNSVADASLKKAACGVHIRLGASLRAPWKLIKTY